MKALERRLTLTNVTAISVSAMVGSGIFVLPGLASAHTGPSVWLAYLLAGLVALPAVLSKAELATAMPTSGGTYVYLERSLGPLGGTIAGVGLWLSMLLKAAFALVGFGAYLIVVADLPLIPTSLALLAVIVGLNVVGVRKVGQAQVAVIAVSLCSLGVLIVAGLWQLDPSRLDDSFTGGASGLLAAAGFVFVSYAGVTKVAAVAEEVKNPSRNLPLGMLLSLGLVMALYALVTLALVGNLPGEALGQDLKPIHTLAETLGGPIAGVAAAILGVLTMTSMANSGLLAASRFPFAMSRDDLVPPMFRHVSSRFETPVVSILVTGGAIAFAIVFLDVEAMAKLASAAVILLYLANNAAVLIFREARVQWYAPTFRSPLYPFTQIAGIVGSLVILATLGILPLLASAGLFLAGLALYLPWGRRKARRLGVLGSRGRRSDLLAEPPVIEDELGRQAAVVVPLFGRERSPEMLVELGAALAGGRHVEVVHLTEVPEQMTIEAALEEDPKVRSLERRVRAMADEGLDIEFHAVVSRDLVRTIHEVSSRLHCEWLVMQWKGASRTKLLPYNPLGWLINHLTTDLALFQDFGVRRFREILVHPEPGPHDALVVRTADDLARRNGAELTFIRFVHDKRVDEDVEREKAYLEQLSRMCEAPTRARILRGRSEVDTIVAATPAYDLLVMGIPDFTFFGTLPGRGRDRLTARAGCSVLSLKTPRQKTHHAFDRERTADGGERFELLAHLEPACIAARVPVKRKEALFERLAQSLSEVVPEGSPKQVADALWARERSQSTAVGDGVAMPHGTLEVDRSLFGVFTTETPVDYQGPDGQPVDVLFVTVSSAQQRQNHLHMLSRLAELSIRTALLERLRAAETREEIVAALHLSTRELEEDHSRAYSAVNET